VQMEVQRTEVIQEFKEKMEQSDIQV